MNWRKFGVVIAFGITGLAVVTFGAFFLSIGYATLSITLWGAGISFTIALLGVAALYGMGAVK